MKNLLFGIIATVLFSFTGNAQVGNIVSGKVSSGTSTVDIPLSLKSDLVYSKGSTEFTVFTKYSEKYKGDVTTILDRKYKIVAIILPNDTLTQQKLGPIGRCFSDCNSGGSETGAFLCYWCCVTGI
jgi:hypothetical protein